MSERECESQLEEEISEAGRGIAAWWRPSLLVLIIAAALVAAQRYGLADPLHNLRGWIKGFGSWGPLVFTLLYVAGSLAALPGIMLTIASGTLFGSVLGIITSTIGTTIAAALAFLIARYVARDSMIRLFRHRRSFRWVQEITGRKGPLVVALARMMPFLPVNNLLNYAFGLTQVNFWTYLVWSSLSMLPATILYAVSGDAAFRMLSHGEVPWSLIVVILLAILLSVYLIRVATRKLRED